MVVNPAELSDMHSVVTGGCSGLGLELAIMLANSGAGVIIGCHNTANEVESRIAKLGLLRASDWDSQSANPLGRSSPTAGWIAVWPLQLESFKSVREFASRVSNNVATLDILVHNAATKEGCTRTEDGHEYTFQA